MRFNRVLLVQAKYDSAFSNVFPAGIGSLSETLDHEGLTNDVFDLNVKRNTEGMLHDKIRHFKPDLIGFSMMSLNYKYNYGVIERLKAIFKDVKVVVGGAHLSTIRKEVLENCKAIDYGVTLEGEHTLLELMKGDEDEPDIKGLLYRDAGRIIYNGDRPFIQDLDSLPYPRYKKFNKSDYSTLVSLFSSRGCPFECTFCPTKLAIGRRFFTRSAKSVVDEMQYHYDLGYRDFTFRDDNFTLVRDRVYEICDEIEKRSFRDIYLMCDAGVRADKVDRDILKRMKDVGFKMVAIGVEAGNDRVLKIIKKSETIAEIDRAIKTACELDYIVELFLLIGAPGETWKDFEDTLSIATRYPVMITSFYHILPYPNTELFDFVKSNNYLLRSYEEYLNDGSQRVNTPFFATPEFSYELRKKAFNYAYKVTSKHVKKAKIAYSRKNVHKKLRAMGMGDKLASFFARIYTADLLFDLLSSNKLLAILKKNMKRRAAVKSAGIQ
ncbi:MAG: B12-binding domain-containing radical SAM protein [Candidatus Omnitrophica bacterium]|nr:B12-binding domain-containing radical SAM protein [Candidatus Omnitrophota bacterium]MBU1808661.1 B12-binding domain-containing radical SAM protein [Candidatus Omnitrophota bacterium]